MLFIISIVLLIILIIFLVKKYLYQNPDEVVPKSNDNQVPVDVIPTPVVPKSNDNQIPIDIVPTPPIDCVVEWDRYWSECDKPCGGGKQTLNRTIKTEPSIDGKACPPVEQRDCNTTPCDIECETSDWSDWSECNQPCGKGKQIRTKKVITFPSENKSCPPLSEAKDCILKPCPFNKIGVQIMYDIQPRQAYLEFNIPKSIIDLHTITLYLFKITLNKFDQNEFTPIYNNTNVNIPYAADNPNLYLFNNIENIKSYKLIVNLKNKQSNKTISFSSIFEINIYDPNTPTSFVMDGKEID